MRRPPGIAVVLCLSCTAPSWADDAAVLDVGATPSSSGRMFSLSGFGTFGVVHSSEHQADFTSYLKPTGAGFSHNWSNDVDSLIAAQITANFTSKLSAVVQVISEQNYDDTYTPHVEWADVSYQFTPELTVRVGRTVSPDFLASDHRKVGYANPWVRPPSELYQINPVTYTDGVDVRYSAPIGDVINTVVGTYGASKPTLPGRGPADLKHSWLLADTVEYGPATARIAYHEARVTLPYLNPFFDAFRLFGPQGDTIADTYDPVNKRAKFFSVGGMYDPGKWFVMGEWGYGDYHSAVGKSDAWYVSGGYRLGKLTPYVTYAGVRALNTRSDPGVTLAGLPPAVAGIAAALNAGLDTILSAVADQTTASVGARWDFMTNVDLKLQVDHTRLGAGAIGRLSNFQPDFRPGGTVNLITVTIDFVF